MFNVISAVVHVCVEIKCLKKESLKRNAAL